MEYYILQSKTYLTWFGPFQRPRNKLEIISARKFDFPSRNSEDGFIHVLIGTLPAVIYNLVGTVARQDTI